VYISRDEFQTKKKPLMTTSSGVVGGRKAITHPKFLTVG